MTFPKDSAFNQPLPNIKVTPKRIVGRRVEATTSVPTADIEDLEHELRDLSYDAGSPQDARLFEELADKVASFYRG